MVVLCPMSLGLCVEDDQCAAASLGDGMGDASRNDVKLAWTYREWQSLNCEMCPSITPLLAKDSQWRSSSPTQSPVRPSPSLMRSVSADSVDAGLSQM